MTVKSDRPQLEQPLRRFELPIREVPPERPVRWIAWTISIVLIAAAALTALVMMNDDNTEPFESVYEAQSPLAYGAIHEPGFEFAPRWMGQSDMTLEEVEMFAAYEASTGEADRALLRYVGQSVFFTSDELAALQASVGAADQKYLEAIPAG